MIIRKMNNLERGGVFRAGRFYPSGLKFLFAAAFCLLISIAANASSFTASLDRDNITLGENATLTLNFDGGQPENVSLPNVPGLQIVKTGYSFNNGIDSSGNSSSAMTVTLNVTPQQTGQFVIPAMTTTINGQPLQTQPITLTVTKPGPPTAAQINSGSQIAFMRLTLPNTKIYPGQVVPAQLQFFFRDDVQHYQDIEFTGQPADGFAVGKVVGGGQGHRIQLGDRTYTVIPASMALTATKAGTLSVGPITANVTVVSGAQPSFFGELVGGQQQRVAMATEPITVISLPLPTQNVPPGFNGAIGDYQWTVTAGPTNVAVGDPITMHVQISGQGPVDSLLLPNQSNWNGFKIFSPTSKVQLNDDLGDAGSKSFEEIVTPQNASVHELPPLSFSYFSPRDGNYHTLTQPAMPLTVTPVSATPLPTIAAATKAVENQTPQDIVTIRENPGELAQVSTPLVMRPAFLALQGVPVIAFFAALIWRRRTDNLANNPRLRRQRAVAQLIAVGTDDLDKYASEKKSNEFFATLFRLLQELLGERLDCPASSITEADVDERLIARGAKPETLNELRELFQACNQARYAAIQTSQELSALASRFRNTAAELQNLKT